MPTMMKCIFADIHILLLFQIISFLLKLSPVSGENFIPARQARSTLVKYQDDIHRHSHTPSSKTPVARRGFDEKQSYSSHSSTILDIKAPDKAWPPWPFNMLSQERSTTPIDTSLHHGDYDEVPVSSTPVNSRRSGAQLLVKYMRTRALFGLRQLQQVGSALGCHLPQAFPPLLLITMLPTRPKIDPSSLNLPTSTIESTTPLISKKLHMVSFAKQIALLSLGISMLTMVDYEIRKKKRLTPLPLPSCHSVSHGNVRNVLLPPFLPEEIPKIESDPLLSSLNPTLTPTSISSNTMTSHEDEETNGQDLLTGLRSNRKKVLSGNPFHFIQKNIIDFYKTGEKMKRIRHREVKERERQTIINELIVLQKLKDAKKQRYEREKKKMQKEMRSSSPSSSPTTKSKISTLSSEAKSVSPLGYALVTGASRGIGRAIAVELARHGLPLILVARDMDKLITLAYEIESYYGVRVNVLQADLSQPHAAKQVYDTTTDWGMHVDVLVNNAGVCTQGSMVSQDLDDLDQMVQINVGSVTKLSSLYGQDMKNRRRGRILFISSVAGASPAVPSAAGYAATKAYEKSFALSIGRELEKFGVGVTTCLPGAVRGTAFSSRSQMEEALCFKIPFYPMTSPQIASRGVTALLSGDPEVIPGWHNRCFLKLFVPLLPQRITTMVTEAIFSPFKFNPRLPWINQPEDELSSSNDSSPLFKPPPVSKGLPPRILTLRYINQSTDHNGGKSDEIKQKNQDDKMMISEEFAATDNNPHELASPPVDSPPSSLQSLQSSSLPLSQPNDEIESMNQNNLVERGDNSSLSSLMPLSSPGDETENTHKTNRTYHESFESSEIEQDKNSKEAPIHIPEKTIAKCPTEEKQLHYDEISEEQKAYIESLLKEKFENDLSQHYTF